VNSAVLAAAGVVTAGGALIVGLVTLAGGAGSTVSAQGAVAESVFGQLQQAECVPSGPVPALTPAQASNAETIVAAAQASGAGDHGAQIALMTAATESGFENLGPEIGNEGSLGLFQQRVT
jgi:hypothetical protein